MTGFTAYAFIVGMGVTAAGDGSTLTHTIISRNEGSL